MAEQLVRGGMPLDIPSADEIGAAMDARLHEFYRYQGEVQEARERERMRGLKRMEWYSAVVPATATFWTGPLVDEGYVWSLRLVGVGMSASNIFVMYRASQSGDTRRPIWVDPTAGSTHVATFSSDQARLRHNDGLYLVPSTGNVTSVYVSAWQLPAEREGEFA